VAADAAAAAPMLSSITIKQISNLFERFISCPPFNGSISKKAVVFATLPLARHYLQTRQTNKALIFKREQ
jgi:hypothetical protein